MSSHSCRVDYYSYTIKDVCTKTDNTTQYYHILTENAPKYIKDFQDEWDWTVPKRKNGYIMGFNVQSAIFVWFNGKDIHVEITGDGCTILYSKSELMGVISDTANEATRIDIALDILCDTGPLDFVAMSQAKTSASGYQISKDGETCYMGSRKSDRFCKVYRYNHPHPRADRLRIEYTYKSHDAIIASRNLISSNEAIMAFSSGIRYKWSHPVYKTLQSPDLIEIKAHRKDRNTAKTVIWYKTQVLPALKKLIKTGDYTIDDILNDLKGLA
jgi:DNA relaxase NicK